MRTENPGVGGSIPSLPTIFFNKLPVSEFPPKWSSPSERPAWNIGLTTQRASFTREGAKGAPTVLDGLVTERIPHPVGDARGEPPDL